MDGNIEPNATDQLTAIKEAFNNDKLRKNANISALNNNTTDYANGEQSDGNEDEYTTMYFNHDIMETFKPVNNPEETNQQSPSRTNQPLQQPQSETILQRIWKSITTFFTFTSFTKLLHDIRNKIKITNSENETIKEKLSDKQKEELNFFNKLIEKISKLLFETEGNNNKSWLERIKNFIKEYKKLFDENLKTTQDKNSMLTQDEQNIADANKVQMDEMTNKAYEQTKNDPNYQPSEYENTLKEISKQEISKKEINNSWKSIMTKYLKTAFYVVSAVAGVGVAGLIYYHYSMLYVTYGTLFITFDTLMYMSVGFGVITLATYYDVMSVLKGTKKISGGGDDDINEKINTLMNKIGNFFKIPDKLKELVSEYAYKIIINPIILLTNWFIKDLYIFLNDYYVNQYFFNKLIKSQEVNNSIKYYQDLLTVFIPNKLLTFSVSIVKCNDYEMYVNKIISAFVVLFRLNYLLLSYAGNLRLLEFDSKNPEKKLLNLTNEREAYDAIINNNQLVDGMLNHVLTTITDLIFPQGLKEYPAFGNFIKINKTVLQNTRLDILKFLILTQTNLNEKNTIIKYIDKVIYENNPFTDKNENKITVDEREKNDEYIEGYIYTNFNEVFVKFGVLYLINVMERFMYDINNALEICIDKQNTKKAREALTFGGRMIRKMKKKSYQTKRKQRKYRRFTKRR